MSQQERDDARARFSALFDDFFAAPRRDDSPHPLSDTPEFTDADLHRDLFAGRQ